MMNQNLPDLRRRFVVSCIIVSALTGIVFYSQHGWMSLLILGILSGFTAVGVWEFSQLAKAKDITVSSKTMMAVAIAEVISFYIFTKFDPQIELSLLILLAGVAVLFLLHFKRPSNSLVKIAVEFFGICYLSVPLSFMLGVLYPAPFAGNVAQDGRWWFVYLVVTTKIIDTGAYFVGRIWGRKKLAPLLSPQKTIEGAIAGFLFAVMASIGLSYLGKHFSHGTFHLPLNHAIWLGMMIGVLAQIGDLSESLLKRDAVVKDSNSLPGLGGVLDMVDSLIFSTPLLYFFMRSQM